MKELRENTAKVRNHTLQRGQNGQILPRREKYYNIVSLTNTSILQALQTETGKHMSGQNGQILLPSVKSGRRAQNCSFSNNQAKETAH